MLTHSSPVFLPFLSTHNKIVYTDLENCPQPTTCASNLNYQKTIVMKKDDDDAATSSPSSSSSSSVGGGPNNGDDDDDDCTTVSWMSLPNVEYLILVSETAANVTASDNELEESSGGGGNHNNNNGYNNNDNDSVAIQVVNNDLCENAYRPLAPPWPKQNFPGFLSSTDTTTDSNVVNGSCGTATIPQKVGVWYEIQGIEGVILADTCSGTIIDTQISVYKGDSCNSLVCVDGNDAACGEIGLQSAVSWNSKHGEIYHILVHGGGGGGGTEEDEEALGSFNLNVQALLVPNDKCNNAIEINPPGTSQLEIHVPLSAATVDPETIPSFTNCLLWFDTTTDDATRGVWYSLIGTGLTYSIEVEGLGRSIPFVTIFDGTCDDDGKNLQCVYEQLHDESGTSLTLFTQDGPTYLIYVFYTRNDQSGDAEIKLRQIINP